MYGFEKTWSAVTIPDSWRELYRIHAMKIVMTQINNRYSLHHKESLLPILQPIIKSCRFLEILSENGIAFPDGIEDRFYFSFMDHEFIYFQNKNDAMTFILKYGN